MRCEKKKGDSLGRISGMIACNEGIFHDVQSTLTSVSFFRNSSITFSITENSYLHNLQQFIAGKVDIRAAEA